MKIEIKNTPKQVELVKAMASKNGVEAINAREAFAKFIGPIVQQVLDFLSTSKLIYKDWPYNEDEDPSFPLDQFYGNAVDQVQVWSQSIAGGLGASLVTGLQELKLHTYRLDTAWALTERNISRGRLPYVSLALNRAANELALRQDRNAWVVIFKALAEASTGGNKHVIDATSDDILQPDDFNRLLTRIKRLNVAFDDASTPVNAFSRGVTDMFMPPEGVEEIRSLAYEPVNTRSGKTESSGATSLALPDRIREELFNASGIPSIYGINIIEMLEFGDGKRYNAIFAAFAAANSITFTAASDYIVVGVDASRDALLRPVAQNAENGAQFMAQVDDQYTKRSGKVGWFGGVDEGRICIDARALSGITV